MNKYELSCLVAKDAQKTIAEVVPIVNSMIKIMADTILANESINFTQLGTFCLKHRPARNGYDVYRKASLVIPESMSLDFKVSPSMRNRIREKYSQRIGQEDETTAAKS